MAKRKREDSSSYNWMDTYGDMVTLLLTFFIMLFAMGRLKYQRKRFSFRLQQLGA